MKIEARDNEIWLRDVFNGICLESPDGEKFAICMRDSGFEFRYAGLLYEAKEGRIQALAKLDDADG